MNAENNSAKHTNRLIHENSPYLLQHAHNPVDWYPWGQEAFDKAKADDKPILVSIGYATCHWCHVMERESFEDESTAAYLNEHFVAIKVDREERPDVDKIYMDALHALSPVGGGWPLNMFLTPERKPFTGGTYFPPQAQGGRPSFLQVLERIQKLWTEAKDNVQLTADAVTEALQSQSERLTGSQQSSLSNAPDDFMVRFAKDRYDSIHGGFKTQRQIKFPPSMALMHLLRIHALDSDEAVIDMIEFTTERMKMGGIYDQIGGGLSRYSTDPLWLVPHFEKMLYDNALWVQLLVELFQYTKNTRYKDWAEDTLTYILRDMTSPEGAFYSAEDADSEGVEGKFYVWSYDELKTLLREQQAFLFDYWTVEERGNFEGHCILWQTKPLESLAKNHKLSTDEAKEIIARARETLFEARNKRPRPLLDDKVLTSWNALMISAFAKAGRAFGRSDYVDASTRALDFVLTKMRDQDGRVLRRYRQGEARYRGQLADVAQLAVACLDVFSSTHKLSYLQAAKDLMAQARTYFKNDEGPFFDTASDAEALIMRSCDGYDGVEPSGNSAACWALVWLFALTGEDVYREDLDRVLCAFFKDMSDRAWGHAYMLRSLMQRVEGVGQIVVVGAADDADCQELLTWLKQSFMPEYFTVFVPLLELESWQEAMPALAGKDAIDGRLTIYICKDQTCQLPIHSLEALKSALM